MSWGSFVIGVLFGVMGTIVGTLILLVFAQP
jgi:hypothetical protein